MLALLGLAGATTLAVLPLEKGSAGERYEGLGAPLAGMIVADLSEVEGLTLVERTRLDAVLAEIELGTEGYLDPATAQMAGSGLGADLVVVGTYSIIEGRFLLEARVVSVETGDILEAAAADGTPADFVAVEKELVEALLDDLELELSGAARRKVIVQTPTESFEAFAAFGQGTHEQSLGDSTAAEYSWSPAVMLDPGYQAPRDALAELKAGLEERTASRAAAAYTAWEQARIDVLDAVGSTVEDPNDNKQLAAFAMRLDALGDLGRDCQRYDEM